ncbi:MAG: pitrilysin family protein [Paracoccaceae bacterium]
MIRILTLILATFLALPAHSTEIQRVTTKSGITAWLVEEHSIPIVSIEILFRGGASIDPIEKHGATYLMTGLLEEGAGALDAPAYLTATEALAAQFSFDSSLDMVSVSATVLRENLDPSMELLRLAITEPRFDDVAFERVREQVYSILRSNENNPRKIAAARFRALSFGDHVYARTLAGNVETVRALNTQDMHTAHKSAMVKSRAYIGVVGDIDAGELEILLDKLLGDLPDDGPLLPPLTQTKATGGVEVISFPSPQSVAVFGHGGIARDDPDYITAFVMNHILGKGFSSRLNQEVREKRGLTYGVSSFLVPYHRAALYMGSLSSANDKITEAMDIVRAEWARMAESGITATELEAAQKYLTGSYPLRFDSNGAIAAILAGLQSADLPMDYVNTRNVAVNTVTLEDINRVAAYLLQPDNLQVVIVGEPVELED